MNSVETNNQIEYTQGEKDLATKYKVEPKLIRMIAEIVCEHTAGICELISLYSGRKKQGPEPEQAETQDQPKKATPITVLQDWLSKRCYTEKLTAVLLWQLINKEDVYKKEGYCEGRIGNELFREYKQAVVDASQDKEYLTKADPEEVSVTGLVTGLLPMRV